MSAWAVRPGSWAGAPVGDFFISRQMIDVQRSRDVMENVCPRDFSPLRGRPRLRRRWPGCSFRPDESWSPRQRLH